MSAGRCRAPPARPAARPQRCRRVQALPLRSGHARCSPPGQRSLCRAGRRPPPPAGGPLPATPCPTQPVPCLPTPRKPSGAYIFYCNAKRGEVKKQHPEFTVGQVGSALGQMWKEESEESKKVRPGCRAAAVRRRAGHFPLPARARAARRPPYPQCLLPCTSTPQPYYEMAAKDKERYNQQLAE